MMAKKRDYIILPLPKWFTGKMVKELGRKGFNVSVKPTQPHPTLYIWKKKNRIMKNQRETTRSKRR